LDSHVRSAPGDGDAFLPPLHRTTRKENSMNAQPSSGRVALVTGGSRGIGAAIVRRLAKEGVHVAFTYINSEQRAKELAAEVSAETGVRVEALRVDAASGDEMVRAVDHTAEEFGSLDILVSNAGIAVHGSLQDPERDEDMVVARLFSTNLHGVVAAARAAASHLPEGGRIILISSVAATRSFGHPVGDYAASKAGLEAYGRSWAHEFGPRGITVNSVQPGATETDMLRGLTVNSVQPGATETDMLPKEDFDHIAASIPMGRVGRPEDIAGAVAFLAGPDANFINGATLVVDGGMSA
jgi:3-oxoacyl-[acyl-carrier protein] reductase